MSDYSAGIKMAVENSLEVKEMDALLPLLHQSFTRKKLAHLLETPEKTLQRPLQKLREKGLVVTTGRTDAGAFIFSFNRQKYP